LHGTVLGVAVRLRHLNTYSLVKKNRRGVGTRHCAGMGVVEWMGDNSVTGMVFVRSDGGDISAMCPTSRGKAPYIFTLNRGSTEEDEPADLLRRDTCYRPFLLKVLGLTIVEWRCPVVHRFAVLLACCISLLIHLSNMFGVQCKDYDIKNWNQHVDQQFVADSCFAVGVLIIAALLPSTRCTRKIVDLCETWAFKNDFAGVWSGNMMKKERHLACMWLFSTFGRAGLWFAADRNADGHVLCAATLTQSATMIVLDVFAFAACSGVFAAVALHIFYVLGALKFSRNRFIVNLSNGMTSYDRAIQNWNMIQALFYELSSSVEVLLVCHVASSFLAIFLYFRARTVGLIRLNTTGHIVVPLLVMALLSMSLLRTAERLTLACTRAPSVINSLGARAKDGDRHFLVEYVKYSDPGFRMFGHLITPQSIVNLSFFVVLALLLVRAIPRLDS